ncbi:hypothetical protein TSAR_014071 [Trichomalopsis sarcophagae]|uniref:Uncharacterized protein n=1 Tax=Trichomalopsis sarcophagae TaxID=543379 RepID=A0A232EEP0_9HYME|nr:hypothetical protein TSAR_014071 [Trichomalopsis sarcophagae]
MQHPTFEGLRQHSSLVDQHLDALKTLVDFKKFKQFYSRHNIAIEDFVLDKMVDDNNDNFKKQYLKIVLSEILGSGLPFIVKDVLNNVKFA